MEIHKYFISCLMLLGILVFTIVRGDDSGENPGTSDGTAVATTQGEIFTEEKCSKAKSGCCSELYIGDESSLLKCFAIHSPKMPLPGDGDTAKSVRFLSCFVECMYKQKKYIGKSDSINMKMVKLDAEKLYADRPKEKEYHIRMFEFCRKDAGTMHNMLKANPGGSALLKGACRPYLLMVYLCETEYHKKKECPYFRWEGVAKDGTKQTCKDARAKCYEVDGIVPQESQSIF